MLYKSRSIITTKISLSKLTNKMCHCHRISLRNKAKQEFWAGSWAEGGKKTFERVGLPRGLMK